MKKILFLISLVMLIFIFTACDGKDDNKDDNKDNNKNDNNTEWKEQRYAENDKCEGEDYCDYVNDMIDSVVEFIDAIQTYVVSDENSGNGEGLYIGDLEPFCTAHISEYANDCSDRVDQGDVHTTLLGEQDWNNYYRDIAYFTAGGNRAVVDVKEYIKSENKIKVTVWIRNSYTFPDYITYK